MKKVLITGGAGFVGRHATKILFDKGYDITVVDDLSTGLHPAKWPRHLICDFTFIKDDVRAFFLKNYTQYDLILHFAAVVGGRLTIENQPIAVAIDLAIDADFFNWAVNTKQGKCFYFSSSAAYPIELQKKENFRLLKEDDILFENYIGMPDMTYGWTKLTGEYLAKIAHKKYGLEVCCFRPFSGYGEDQDFAYPFPSIIKRAFEKKDPFEIWGSGDQMRDFIYIDDAIEASLLAGEKINDGSAVNLGTGILTSFKGLATKACNKVGFVPKFDIKSDKPEGVFARGADVSVLKKILGEQYKEIIKTSIDQGIEKTLSYFE